MSDKNLNNDFVQNFINQNKNDSYILINIDKQELIYKSRFRTYTYPISSSVKIVKKELQSSDCLGGEVSKDMMLLPQIFFQLLLLVVSFYTPCSTLKYSCKTLSFGFIRTLFI